MQTITLFLVLYLLIGFIYGIYVTFWGGGRWWLFPINVLGGPIIVGLIIYRTLRGQKFHLG